MGSTDEEEAQTEAELMSGVFRDYVLLEEGQTVTDLAIKFQKSKIKGVENSQVCMGVFDQLSYLANFNEDNTPKTTTVNYFKHDGTAATYNTPNIFTDPEIKFSSIPLITDKSANGNPSFLAEENSFSPTSFFVLEKSIITARDKDLAYKAWFDIEIAEFFSLGDTSKDFKGGIGQFVPMDARKAAGQNINDEFKKPTILRARNIKSVDITYGQFRKALRSDAVEDFNLTPSWAYNGDCFSFLTIEFFEPLSRSNYLPDIKINVNQFPRAYGMATFYGPISQTEESESVGTSASYRNPYPSVDLMAAYARADVGLNSSRIPGGDPAILNNFGKDFHVYAQSAEAITLYINHGSRFVGSMVPGRRNIHPNLQHHIRLSGGILENSLNDQV